MFFRKCFFEIGPLTNLFDNPEININSRADIYTFQNHFYENIELNLKDKLSRKMKIIIKMFLNPIKGILYIRDKIF